jgi:hypothetical protein
VEYFCLQELAVPLLYCSASAIEISDNERTTATIAAALRPQIFDIWISPHFIVIVGSRLRRESDLPWRSEDKTAEQGILFPSAVKLVRLGFILPAGKPARRLPAAEACADRKSKMERRLPQVALSRPRMMSVPGL